MTRSSVLVNLAAFSVWLLVPYFLARVPAYSLAESGAILACCCRGCAGRADRRSACRTTYFRPTIGDHRRRSYRPAVSWRVDRANPLILRIASLYTIIRPSAAVVMAYARSSA